MPLNLSFVNLRLCNQWTNCLFRRYISTTTSKRAIEHSVITDDDRKRFDTTFPQVVKCLTSNSDARLKPVMDHCKTALEYNVPHGKKQRGLLTVAAYKLLTDKQSEEQLFLVSILGWCVELLQASFLVSDDIIDSSITRRGKPCWHRQDDVGIHFAVNDVLMLETGLYQLLRTYFREKDYYINVVDLFHDISSNTVYGQIMDIQFAKKNFDGSRFTEENYDAVCHHKTSLYSYYLPVVSAMYMSGINDTAVLNITKEILLKIGRLFQIQAR